VNTTAGEGRLSAAFSPMVACCSGHMICEDHRAGGHGEKPVHLHSAKEDWGEEGSRFASKNGRIFCENFVIFPYLSDVHEGDGGVLVLPGSRE